MLFDLKNSTKFISATATFVAISAGSAFAQDRNELDDTQLHGQSQSVIDNKVPNSASVEKGEYSPGGRDRSALIAESAPVTEKGIAVEHFTGASPEAIAFADNDNDGHITSAEMEVLEAAHYELNDGHVEATKLAVGPLGFGTAHADDLEKADMDSDGYLTVAELESLRDMLNAQTKVQ